MTRVLIVDDDIQPLRAPWINLTTRGCTVVIAADDRTALHAAADRSPEVIVLDLGLPDLDGADVITELRTFTQAPIIVHSARTDPRDTVHALDRGADDYVTKPLGVDELAARLRAAVRAPLLSPPTARGSSQSGRHDASGSYRPQGDQLPSRLPGTASPPGWNGTRHVRAV